MLVYVRALASKACLLVVVGDFALQPLIIFLCNAGDPYVGGLVCCRESHVRFGDYGGRRVVDVVVEAVGPGG